ncbi:hypothetical protein I3842_05G212100 [Carya illinoinensis]|uniref:RNase H type-1 domain-containing protein n=1 Tax=Carya illinoinensis TaxID=32201 RepID=A0A922F792_CARIL|nr:hypothetical protein I3842_05G212100 [Carya illinoinensis]
MLQRASKSLEAYPSVQQPGQDHNANAVLAMRGLRQWRKPSEYYMKANWDAAVDVKSKITGLGIIIRDAEGGCQEIIQATNAQQETWTTASSLIYDIKSMLKTRLGWKFPSAIGKQIRLLTSYQN